MRSATDPPLGGLEGNNLRRGFAKERRRGQRRRSATSPARDLDWLLPVAAITAIELGLWLFAWRAGAASSPLFTRYGTIGYLILSVAGLVAFLYQLSIMALRREPHPLRCSAEMIRNNGLRILIIVVAVQLNVLSGAAFSAIKTAMPNLIPYWVDPYAVAFEQRLFGADPYLLSQRLFGWATPAIDFVYATWLAVQIVAFYVLVLLKPSPLKTRALLSHSLSWLILGIVGAYLLSSVGPIFYDRVYGGHEFAGLLGTLDHAPVATQTSDMLWRAYSLHTKEIASGISAMPSLHVAMAFWLAMVVRAGCPRGQFLAWIYFGLICLGSVHLGWHYVSDGVIGTAGAALIWGIAGRLVHGVPPKNGAEVFAQAGS